MKKMLVLLTYISLCGTPGTVDELVNYYAKNGYKLYGNPTLMSQKNVPYVCQAMTLGKP